jgi:RHS repeat-associated protein
MSYDKMGGITEKRQTASSNYPGYPGTPYRYLYTHGGIGAPPHATTEIWDRKNRKQYTYKFDGNGNPTTTHEQKATIRNNQPNPSGPITLVQENYWDEQNQLRGLWNLSGLHHYIYDADGQRLMKSSMPMAYSSVNAQKLQATNSLSGLDYTVYVSAGMVFQGSRQGATYTKHYYAGPLRVASHIGSGNPNQVTHPTSGGNKAQGGPAGSTGSSNGLAVLGDLNGLLAHYGMSVPPTAPPTDTIAMQVLNDPAECDAYYGDDVIEKNRCLCDHFPDVALQQGIDCSPYTPIYWYHPDYIGNVEFVSDRTGQPYQHFYYAPFGDPMVSQHVGTGSFNSDFRFNAKEFDEETGNYYYGARYYQPKSSVWMGVDALATSYPGMNPYNFVMGNPIMAIDPDGNDIEVPDDTPDSEMTPSDWRVSDRINNRQTWKDANRYNTMNKIQNQYKGFDQVNAYYSWAQGEFDRLGHEMQWINGAQGLVEQLTVLSFMQDNAEDGSFIKLLTELNEGIQNFALINFADALSAESPITGQDAYEWDRSLVIREQRDIARPIYSKYLNTSGYALLNDLTYRNPGAGIPSFAWFNNYQQGDLLTDWQLRVDVPMFMMYGNTHTALYRGPSLLVDAQTGKLNSRGQRIMKYYYVQ